MQSLKKSFMKDGEREDEVKTSIVINRECPVKRVIVHPLVLLSVVDHFYRLGKVGTQKRVIGVLLGSLSSDGALDVSNSFALPFEETDKDSSVWFLDHEYLEIMYGMFKKVNAREKIVGWYQTGPKLCPNDLEINEIFQRFNRNSVLVIVEVSPNKDELPMEAYIAREELRDDGTPLRQTFEHLPSEIGAEEAEEVGVEHLLRDIKDTSVGSLSQTITAHLHGLRGLRQQLRIIRNYLHTVKSGAMPTSHDIIANLQDIFNLMPDTSDMKFIEALTVTTNDQLMSVYVASIGRSLTSINNLIDNKIKNKNYMEKKVEDAEKSKTADGEKEKEKGDKTKSSSSNANPEAKQNGKKSADEGNEKKAPPSGDKKKKPKDSQLCPSTCSEEAGPGLSAADEVLSFHKIR